MALPDALLEPISDDRPTGENLSAGAEYAEIETAYRDADVPPGMLFAEGEGDQLGDFSEVVALAESFLEERSKDLQIATFYASARLRTDGFEGLDEGLELIHGLLERYWDDLHPDPAARAAILDWLGGDDPRGTEPLLRVAYVTYLTPLTDEGHTFFHFRDWRKLEDEGETPDPGDADELSAATFGPAMEALDWAWYDELARAVERCEGWIEQFGEFETRFEEAEVRPPRFTELAGALGRVHKAIEELRDRKPAPVRAQPEVVDESPDPEDGEPSSAGATSAGAPQVSITEPRDAREAGLAIAASARVLRRLDPTDPTPYLLLRGYRWGELRALGDDPDPRAFAKALAAPTTEQRTRLKTLFLDERWGDLLETAEELVSKPIGRGWLDLQRYVVLSADRLGPEYGLVSAAVKTAVGQLLRDIPELVHATLMDDVATASRDTREWLRGQGLMAGGDEAGDAGAEEAARDTDSGRAVREASFARATALARSGDPHGAIELLLDRAEREASERERFITRSKAIEIMLDNGMKGLALPTLRQLNELVTKHDLEAWEPAEVVARPLALLYRCLDDGKMKEELHDRLARLDPVFFMQATRERKSAPARSDRSASAGAGAEEASGDDDDLEDLDLDDLDALLDEDDD